MNALDRKLEKIISDSDIYFYKDEVEAELYFVGQLPHMDDAARKMWGALPRHANIAIYGLGYDSHYLFGAVDLTTHRVICMIDNNPELAQFNGYPVIRSADIPKYPIDIILITSHLYYEEMKASVEAVAPDCKIVYMWDEFYAAGYILPAGVEGDPVRERFIKPLLLNRAVASYHETDDFRYLLYSIRFYLAFRDLRNALVLIDQYLDSNCPNTHKMLNFKNALRLFLDEIKQKLEAKHHPHTLVLIADCMAAEDLTPELAPFLYAFGKANINCPNAHAHMGFTTTSILTIFKQKSYLDHYLFRDVKIAGSEPIFEYLEKNKIDFSYSAPYVKDLFASISEAFKLNRNGCADMIWQYLCMAYENDKKGLHFLHFSETHSPYLCLHYHGRLRHLDSPIFFDCVKYVDAQVEFLCKLLPHSTKLLFSSDHGHSKGFSEEKSKTANKISYESGAHHIPYVICDRKTHCGTDTRLVSHLDTMDILMNLLSDKPAFDSIKTHALVEFNQEFVYAERALEVVYNLKPRRACKCFISDKDKYIIFHDGEEMYFLLGDSSANLIDDVRYADRIHWFRENVNRDFPDWSDDNGRYDLSRIYYDMGPKKGV